MTALSADCDDARRTSPGTSALSSTSVDELICERSTAFVLISEIFLSSEAGPASVT